MPLSLHPLDDFLKSGSSTVTLITPTVSPALAPRRLLAIILIHVLAPYSLFGVEFGRSVRSKKKGKG